MFKKLIENLKNNPPLVHNITNYVTVNDCANIVLAAGGSPLMADDEAEVEDIVSISNALYINVGTLNARTIGSMIKAGKRANSIGIPAVLDPVGMGASSLRNEAVNRLVGKIDFSVIKGNMSEIKALYTNCKNSGGVDVQEGDAVCEGNIQNAVEFAKKVAQRFDSIIVITGALDIVTDGSRVSIVKNGHPMMSKITGAGCMGGGVIGTYCAANADSLYEASVMAMAVMGVCAEKAYEKVSSKGEGSASFRRYLIDEVSLVGYEDLKEGVQIENR